MYVYCRTIVGVASLSDLYTSTGFSILLWLECNVNFISHHYITNQTAPHHYFHVSHSTISRRRDWFKIADDPAMLEYYGICSWAITIFCSTPTFLGCQYWPELSLNCSESNFMYLSIHFINNTGHLTLKFHIPLSLFPLCLYGAAEYDLQNEQGREIPDSIIT